MPFSPSDARKHTKKATTTALRKKWAEVANSSRETCLSKGGSEKECDAQAIKKANGVIARETNSMPPITEAETKKVGGRTHDRGDFLVVEDTDKTSTWHLPVKIRGTASRALAGAAWAALFSPGGHRGKQYEGPDKNGAKRRLRALYKAQEWEEPSSEAEIQYYANLQEGYYSDEFISSWSPATSFSDLDAQRETQEAVRDLRNRTSDLMMMVDNVMWSSEIEDKVPALSSLFDEYLSIVREHLGTPSTTTEGKGEAIEADLEELGLSPLSISEVDITDPKEIQALHEFGSLADLSSPRRMPVLVDFSIIRPGPGNKKHNNYYPAETLIQAGPLFEGVDIFVTDHKAEEKGEKTKVGRFRTPGTLTEQGLVSRAIIYDPDQAEKTRNRADAGELHTLHCSIYANGKGRPSTVDGINYTVIESFTSVSSVDLVSRAGAGGRALHLAENIDGGIDMDPQTPQEETPTGQETAEEPEVPATEVDIAESDTSPPETAEPTATAPPQEEPVPTLSSERVEEILSETDLDDKAKGWITGRTYETEEALQAAISEMKSFISDLAPAAGQPFALGETTPAEIDAPQLLTAAELEKRKADRLQGILAEVAPHSLPNLYG